MKDLLGANYLAFVIMGLVHSKDPGHSKIGNFRIHICLQENVTCFEVTVYNCEPWILMEIKNPPRNPSNDRVSSSPVQLTFVWRVCVCIHELQLDLQIFNMSIQEYG